MVITKQSFRFDPTTNRFVSGRQGGGFIEVRNGKIIRSDNAGEREISLQQAQTLIARGQQADLLKARRIAIKQQTGEDVGIRLDPKASEKAALDERFATARSVSGRIKQPTITQAQQREQLAQLRETSPGSGIFLAPDAEIGPGTRAIPMDDKGRLIRQTVPSQPIMPEGVIEFSPGSGLFIAEGSGIPKAKTRAVPIESESQAIQQQPSLISAQLTEPEPLRLPTTEEFITESPFGFVARRRFPSERAEGVISTTEKVATGVGAVGAGLAFAPTFTVGLIKTAGFAAGSVAGAVGLGAFKASPEEKEFTSGDIFGGGFSGRTEFASAISEALQQRRKEKGFIGQISESIVVPRLASTAFSEARQKGIKPQKVPVLQATEKGLFTELEIGGKPGKQEILSRDEKRFAELLEIELKERGVPEEKIPFGIAAGRRLTRAADVGVVSGFIFANVSTELGGLLNVGTAFKKVGKVTGKRKGLKLFNLIGLQIAKGGFQEGVAVELTEEIGRFQKPQPIKIAGAGFLGAATAGTIGGAIGALGPTSPRISKNILFAARVSDPFEYPGDLIASASNQAVSRSLRVPVLTPGIIPGIPTTTLTVTETIAGSSTTPTTITPQLTPTILPTSTPTTVSVPIVTPTPIPITQFTPTNIPTLIPTPTPTPVPTITPTPTSTPVSVTIPTSVPTSVPTSIPTTIPTTIPTAVPTIIPRIPIIPFFPLGAGGSGRGIRRGRTSRRFRFQPSLVGVAFKIPRNKKVDKVLTGIEVRGIDI